MILGVATRADAPELARVHAEAFDDSWSAADIASLLTGPGGFALAARLGEALAGFALARVIAGEAELLTIAVAPAHRRSGCGAALVEAVAAQAAAGGAGSLFLEVAADNTAALGLYRNAGFQPVGQRPAYYRRRQGAMDALVFRRALNSPRA